MAPVTLALNPGARCGCAALAIALALALADSKIIESSLFPSTPAEDDALLMPDSLPPATPLPLDAPAVVEAANWALQHLRAMSDSGAFEALMLARIAGAAAQRGVLHDVLLLERELAHPRLLGGGGAGPGGAGVSAHSVAVMTDREDGVRSFTIDAFPLLEPEAVEQAWLERADEAAARREAEFRRLERERRLLVAQTPSCALLEAARGSEAAALSAACEAERDDADARLKLWPTDAELAALEAEMGMGAAAATEAQRPHSEL